MQKALKNMDIGIIPQERNAIVDLSFPTKLGEFIALGIPVIIPQIPAVLDYFPPHTLFYHKGGPQGIAQAVIDIVQNPAEAQKRSRLAFQSLHPIRWEIMEERYFGLVRELISKTG
jgi:glycosyltransferase involved in cell wall biosynthesis